MVPVPMAVAIFLPKEFLDSYSNEKCARTPLEAFEKDVVERNSSHVRLVPPHLIPGKLGGGEVGDKNITTRLILFALHRWLQLFCRGMMSHVKWSLMLTFPNPPSSPRFYMILGIQDRAEQSPFLYMGARCLNVV